MALGCHISLSFFNFMVLELPTQLHGQLLSLRCSKCLFLTLYFIMLGHPIMQGLQKQLGQDSSFNSHDSCQARALIETNGCCTCKQTHLSPGAPSPINQTHMAVVGRTWISEAKLSAAEDTEVDGGVSSDTTLNCAEADAKIILFELTHNFPRA
uniref:Uncharacterized protein n=1 Tax=Dromaius novaehollandiae TaxID=8790 RepID=A0A8C4P8A1_DRONO